MTERELHEALKRGLRASMPDAVRRNVLMNIREEEQIVKKKLSFGAVVAIAMILLSAVAVAWGLSQAYFEGVADLQSQSGYYEDWGMEEKETMVGLLEESGLVEADALTDERSIDQYMIERYGINGREDVIGLNSILETELGDSANWDNDTWIWYTEMQLERGLLSGVSDTDRYFVPGAEAIPPEEAIEKAKMMVMELGSMTQEKLDAATIVWHYKTRMVDKLKTYLHYHIRIIVPDGETTKTYTFDFMPDGSKYEEDATDLNVELDREARDLLKACMAKCTDANDYHIYRLSLEAQKDITNTIRPMVQLHMTQYPNYFDSFLAWFADHYYGLPDEKAITQVQAEAIAREALPQLGVEAAEADAKGIFYVNYEVTDPANPLWKISWEYRPTDDFDDRVTYRVFIGAYTGQITETVVYPWGNRITTAAQGTELTY